MLTAGELPHLFWYLLHSWHIWQCIRPHENHAAEPGRWWALIVVVAAAYHELTTGTFHNALSTVWAKSNLLRLGKVLGDWRSTAAGISAIIVGEIDNLW
jgi:hypothetical protein